MQSKDNNRIKLSRYEDYNHNKKYQRALSTQIALEEYDYMFTFQCDREVFEYIHNSGIQTRGQVSVEELKSLVNEFFKRFNCKLLGKKVALKSPERWIRFVGFPETRSRHGERVQLHCHVLVKSTPELEKYFSEHTGVYLMEEIDRIWGRLAQSSRGVSSKLDIQVISDDYGVAAYCTKHLWNEASQSMLFTHQDFVGRKRLYDELQR
jgi:hypothetical protein